jgi:predicted nucleotidyltransferase
VASVNSAATEVRQEIERLGNELSRRLGENLCALYLYGSAVRGDFDRRQSDINILVVLQVSTPAARRALREGIKGKLRIEPLIVEIRELHRTARVFGAKFASIMRNCRLLAGDDVLQNLEISNDLLLLLTEQELRNLKMRATYVLVTPAGNRKRMVGYLKFAASKALMALSDAVRCAGIDLPRRFEDRTTILADTLGVNLETLNVLIGVRRDGSRIKQYDVEAVLDSLVAMVTKSLEWMEQQWPAKN